MGGITSGIGLASGLDSAGIIRQLLAIESRPRLLAQQRLGQIQVQQSAFLDINSRLGGLRSIVSSMRTQPIFDAKSATSSDESVLGASASASAAQGTFKFLVDRLVSTEQRLSRGFSSADGAPVGAEAFTFEGDEARLDRETALADLNGGNGIERGVVRISDGSTSAEVDLSRAATVTEVVDAVNAADVGVTASVRGGSFVLTADSGDGSDITVDNVGSADVAGSLGLGGTLSVSGARATGSSVFGLSENTPLSLLNDGNGVFANTIIGQTADFTIAVDGDERKVRLGELFETVDGEFELVEGRAVTVGDALGRINEALDGTGVTAQINAEGNALELVDPTGTKNIELADGTGLLGSALNDLGFSVGGATGTISGEQVLAGMNSTLTRTLAGVAGDLGDGILQIRARDGTLFNVTIADLDTDVNGLLDQIRDQVDTSKVQIGLDDMGTGLVVTDTSGGSGNLSIVGSGGSADTAAALGISTGVSGVAADSFAGERIQRQYISLNTRLEDLNGGQGVGTGTIRIVDSSGKASTVEIGTDTQTIGDLIREIDSAVEGDDLEVRINDAGDGLLLADSGGGATRLRVEDVAGSVAASLRIAGESSGTDADNTIEGRFEVRVEFEADDTLRDVATKINEAGVGVTAAIVNEGVGANPFRLSLTSRQSGAEGRTVIDTGGFDLGLTQLERGEDARLFFGSDDPAKAVLITSSSNTVSDVIEGLTLDLKAVSDSAVTVTVDRDSGDLEAKVDEFVEAFNTTLDRIDFQSRFDPETEQRGPLLGDGTLLGLKSAMISTITGPPLNVSGRFDNLSDVGITIGEGGRLELDRDALAAAIEQDPQAVEDLLVAREVDSTGREIDLGDGITATNPDGRETFSSLGVFARVEELARTYVDSVDGVLTERDRALQRQADLQEDRIEQFDIRLEDKRLRLEREFAALERAIADLQAQQSALASLQVAG